MSSKQPGPKRVKVSSEDRQRITPDVIHGILVEVIRDQTSAVPAKGSAALTRVARELQTLRDMFTLEVSESWSNSRRHRARLAEGISILKEAVPPMLKEFEAACARAKIEEKGQAEIEFGIGLGILRSLALSAARVERSWILSEEKGRPRETRWENYGDQILRTLQQHLPDLKKEEKYRFIAAIVRHITGEIVSRGAVYDAIREGIIVKWGN